MAVVTLKIKIDLPGLKTELESAVKEIISRLEPLGVIDVDIETGDAKSALKGVKDEVEETGRKADTTREKFSQWGMIIAGYQAALQSVKQVWNVLTQPLDVAGEFEQFNIQFEVLLGNADAAAKRMEELSEFAKTTPFELNEITNASRQLEVLTRGAISTGDGLRLVGDVASGTGQRIDELSTWFGRLYDGIQSGRPVGEAMMRLQELGVVSGDVRNRIEQMQKSNVEAVKIWDEFTGSMDRFGGMMEKQSASYLGMKSNLDDTITTLLRDIGSILLPLAKDVLTTLIKGTETLKNNLDALFSIIKIGTATIIAYTIAFEGAAIATKVYTFLLGAARTAQLALNTAIATSPIGAAIAVITFLLAVLGELTDWFGLAKSSQDELSKSTSNLKEETEDLTNALNILTTAELAGMLIKLEARLQHLKSMGPLAMPTKQYLEEKQRLTDLMELIEKIISTRKIGIKLITDKEKEAIENLKQGTLDVREYWRALARDMEKWIVEGQKEMLENDKVLGDFKVATREEVEARLIDAMNDGKTKEIAALDLWLKTEKDKYAEYESGKAEMLLAIDEQYKKKKADIDKKYDNLEREKIRELTAEYERHFQFLFDSITYHFSYQQRYSDAEVELSKLQYQQQLQSLKEQLASEEITQQEYRLREQVAHEQNQKYLQQVEEDRQHAIVKISRDVQNYLFQLLKDYLAKYIAQKVAEKIIHAAAETEKTASTEQNIIVRLALMAAELAQTLVLAAAKVLQAIAEGIASLFASLGPFAIPVIGGMVAATMAVWGGIKRALGFRKAGYTGDGSPDEEAGIVHKEEYVFESDLVSREKSNFALLHKLLRSGVTLSQIFSVIASKVNPITEAPLALSGINLSPNIQYGQMRIPQNKIESLLLSIDDRLRKIEDKGFQAEVRVKGEAKLQGRDIYIAYEEESKFQNKRKAIDA